MTSFAIDFVLKNLGSLSKWMLQKAVEALTKKATHMAGDETRKKAIAVLEKSDYEILQQAVELLKSDSEKLASMITKQAKAVLTAIFSHAERRLIIMLVTNFY
jgi:hypothetical protein